MARRYGKQYPSREKWRRYDRRRYRRSLTGDILLTASPCSIQPFIMRLSGNTRSRSVEADQAFATCSLHPLPAHSSFLDIRGRRGAVLRSDFGIHYPTRTAITSLYAYPCGKAACRSEKNERDPQYKHSAAYRLFYPVLFRPRKTMPLSVYLIEARKC